MQPLKDAKNCFMVRRADPDPVIGDGKAPGIKIFFDRDLDTRGMVTPVLDCVLDQILKKFDEMGLVPFDNGERLAGYNGAAFLNGGLKILKHFSKKQAEINGFSGMLLFRSHLCVSQEINEQCPHPFGAFGNEVNAKRSLIVKLSAIALDKELGVAGNDPKWLLQITAGSKSK